MFFANVTEPFEIEFHGVKYMVSPGANNNHRKCRDNLILDIFEKVRDKSLSDIWTPEELAAVKKQFISKLKEWEKNYVGHAKSFNPEMGAIHDAAMKPLTNLMKSNYDFYCINEMIRKEREREDVPPEDRIPEWRRAALERVFVEDYSEMCRILTAYDGMQIDRKNPEAGCKRLKDPYDIKQMLDTLKVENWRGIKPFKFYFKPLETKLNASIKELLDMNKRGRLQVRYAVTLNENMHETICATIAEDVKVQWLAATPLKRDQFKFLYETQDILYQCALRTEFLAIPFDNADDLEKDRVFMKVIPELTVLRALLRIRDIDDKKKADAAHEDTMKKRLHLYVSEPEEEETKDEPLKIAQATMTSTMRSQNRKKKVVEIDPEELERQRKEAAFQHELKVYGVSVNYILWLIFKAHLDLGGLL